MGHDVTILVQLMRDGQIVCNKKGQEQIALGTVRVIDPKKRR